jgi:prepilin-type processing-associated H-X9-DG protein
MHKTLLSALALTLLLLTSHARAAFDPDARAAAVAPYLDEQAFGVIHIDLAKVHLAEARKLVISKLTMLPKEAPAQMEKEEAQATKWLAALTKAGAREIYVVLSLQDLPARPPFMVVKSAADADHATIKSLIQLGPQRFANDEVPPADLSGEVIAGNLVLGHANTIARLKEQKPAAKPDLAQAFKVAGDTAVQAVLLQSDDTRRVLSETLPSLPGDLREYSGKDLSKGIKYAAVGFDFPPKVALRVGIQSEDEASAANLQTLIQDALALGGKEESIKQLLPRYDELVKAITPQRNGDRLSLMVNEDNGGVTKVISLLTPPVQAARAAAQRAQSTNNLKQLALAMHIYHDANKAFPPAATSKGGKSLLSWRVQILPYIEQNDLYNEFHHDEPWDSDHNKKLIEKMPKLYASPAIDLKPGMTTYLVPTGKGMVFNGDQKTGIAQIRDGTSNTIMIVEADADKAVEWTRPDDLPIDLDKPMAGLGHVYKGGFNAAFCDGSVRFISDKIDPKTLSLLFQADDGQPVRF